MSTGKYGLIGRRVCEAKLDSIASSIVTQGLFGRLLNYGNIILSVPGHYAGSVPLLGVADPIRVRAIIEDACVRKAGQAK
ncbi:PH domain-containing protein [Infirmifilum lucidum]|uniref:PH domain-containing protein n=1 Tax=Infirmifilum lucidum TaxID=2776706 RepID=A0A7L9FJB5_9CREN|nr:PH domain-containing protein [Infirmifilum lucidum]QOJ79014.1 PH domain-containing protein [Infirmifilum lucidum]